MRSPAGVWVIGQISSATAAPSSLVSKALGSKGVVGYGPRIPASMLFNADQSVNLAVFDLHRNYSLARGKLFKPRVIWGKYTPSWAMGPRIAGFAGPAPYLAGGGANGPFEAAQAKAAAAAAAWMAGKPDVVEADCGWYSLNYSELYDGPEIQTLYGESRSVAEGRFISWHERLIDINHAAFAKVGVPVGFGLSGHGPIGGIAKALGEHAATLPLGEVYVQANGFDQTGEWGGALEKTHDANIWVGLKGQVGCGLQDISAKAPRTAAQVRQMWDSARKLQSDGVLIVYVEQYYYQWDGGGSKFHADAAAYDEFLRQIAAFVPSAWDVPGDTTLADLQAELAQAQSQLPALSAEVTADAAALGHAQSALTQADAEARDSAARLEQLQTEIENLEQAIAELTG